MSRGHGRVSQEFLGSKNHIFSNQDTQAWKFFDFFLANNSRQVIIKTFPSLWQGICTFWQEFVHFGENLYILVRLDWLSARKNLEKLLASVSRQWKFLNFFLPTIPPPGQDLLLRLSGLYIFILKYLCCHCSTFFLASMNYVSIPHAISSKKNLAKKQAQVESQK